MLIIGILLLILAAAAAGIWYLLRSAPPQSSTGQPPAAVQRAEVQAEAATTTAATESAATESAAAEQSGSADSRIQPAPSTAMPQADLRDTAAPKVRTLAVSPLTTDGAPPAVGRVETSRMEQANTAVTDAASQFLRNVHIGALRTGNQAKVMLNGVYYAINDVVDAETELRFLGTRAQQLVFKDRNGTIYVKSF